ncbi:hypothetical protein [Paenibacillus lemnae]|uniref:Uncharacterized protein n=1 Tax=Paenibacillus lemnae TaxID=1330551 RepID=A0A848M713_PAELE|nr:hypothetical protein [Paenibacillus lemnae]NMO95872.1 hypothetical protein [Paenibacillus lemnae]
MNPDSYIVMSDLYNRVFAVQVSNPDLMVDYVIWNRILSQLPRDYVLPDPLVYNIG